MIDLVIEEHETQAARIKVIGIGGAGSNTVNSIIDSGSKGIDFIVANTDAQALENSKAVHKIQIGLKSTKGLGAGANPELGQRAAEEDIDKLMELLGDADIVFLAAGMGGGTGSGGISVVARALKEHGILSIAVVTKPFSFEGKRRARVANEAIEKLRKEVDTLIVMPNQKLIDIVDKKVSMIDAFSMINDVLSQSVTGISDIITKPGHINVDFADVRVIMKDMGLAVLGTGRARGENRAREAALQAISSPLLENMSIDGARGVLLNITGGVNLGLHEISDAASIIYERADEDATIILGSVIDPTMTDEVSVTVIATGFQEKVQMEMVGAQSTGASHVAPAAVQNTVQPQVNQKQVVLPQQVVQDPVAMEHDAAPVFGSSGIDVDEVHVQKEMSVYTEAQPAKQMAAELHQFVDSNDLDIPAFLRKKSQDRAQQ
ncbi:MAG TPA: cell division protein FtsZ [Candidatus Babeliales bacterium]|nr:cell division protein FtsZ [Candidatus Babeliales bacterium]